MRIGDEPDWAFALRVLRSRDRLNGPSEGIDAKQPVVGDDPRRCPPFGRPVIVHGEVENWMVDVRRRRPDRSGDAKQPRLERSDDRRLAGGGIQHANSSVGDVGDQPSRQTACEGRRRGDGGGRLSAARGEHEGGRERGNESRHWQAILSSRVTRTTAGAFPVRRCIP